jgi:hypothetical protein
LIEGNVCHLANAAMELKPDVRQWTVSLNTTYNIRNDAYPAVPIGVNMSGIPASAICVYRNTLRDGVTVRSTDPADRPFVPVREPADAWVLR